MITADARSEGRLFNLDLVKFIALLLMPFMHVLAHFRIWDLLKSDFPVERLELESGLLYNIVPGVFMICLGCGIVLTRNSTPLRLARRGITLMFISLLLNFIRFSIFFAILGLAKKDSSLYINCWYWFIASDILPFAGLSFMFFALVKKWNFSNTSLLLIGLLLTFGQSCIPEFDIHNETMRILLGNFVYIDLDAQSFFPFVSWIIYPILGYLLQNRINETKNSDKVYKEVGLISAIIGIVFFSIMYVTKAWDSRFILWGELEFKMDAPTTIICVSICGVYMSLMYFLSKKLTNLKIRSIVINVSKNVNKIYCIHWILLMYVVLTALLSGFEGVRYGITIYILGAVLFVVSVYISTLLKKKQTAK